MKKSHKYISILLAILMITNPAVSYGIENPQNSENLEPVEEVITEPLPEPVLSKEEQQLIKEAEEDAILEKEIERVKDKSIKELTTAYLLGDYETGEIFESYNIDKKVAIASTTKILSVFVVLDQISSGKISMEDKITIDADTARVKGSSYDLKEGEVVTVKELVDAAMIVSANDAVYALSKYIAGNEKDFTVMMGEKLKSLGITDYQIINSTGLPDYNINAQNEMTTRDLFALSRAFIKAYPEILEITKTSRMRIEPREFYKRSTDPLLGVVPEVDGLKTGYTGLAGRCLISTGMKYETDTNLAPFRLIGITMGSGSDGARFVAAKNLMTDAFSSYNTIKIADDINPVKTLELENLYPKELNIFNKESFTKIIKTQDTIWSEMEVLEITPDMKKNDIVGHIKYFDGEEMIFETDLIIKEDIRQKSVFGLLVTIFNKMYDDVNKLFNQEGE